MLVLFHGESPDPDAFCLDRETKFLKILKGGKYIPAFEDRDGTRNDRESRGLCLRTFCERCGNDHRASSLPYAERRDRRQAGAASLL